MLLFFLTGLSFEIKRIIIAFWAFVKRENENFSRKFWGGERRIATGAVRPRNDTSQGGAAQAWRADRVVRPYGRVIGGALPGVRKKPGRADVGIGPYGSDCRGGRPCPPDVGAQYFCRAGPVCPAVGGAVGIRYQLTPSFSAAGPPGRGAFGPGLWGYSPRRFLWTDPGGTG